MCFQNFATFLYEAESASPPFELGQVSVTASTNQMCQDDTGLPRLGHKGHLSLSLSLSPHGTQPLHCKEAQATWIAFWLGVPAGVSGQPAPMA